MASRSSLSELYKLEAEVYDHHTVQIRKVRRVEEKEIWDHVKKIGWGLSGVVWLQEKIHKGDDLKQQRAVKVLEKERMKQMDINYMKELEALMKFRTPKISQEEVLVNFYGWFEDKDTVFLAMEYFPYGDLDRYIMSKSITEQDTKDITIDLLKAVKLMHAEGFTHRDIKPKNILVFQNSPKWWVKLGDFGISKRIGSTATALRTNMGTPLYSAPEIGSYGEDDDGVYTNAVDLWSVGCVVYHILTQRVPFSSSQAKRKPFPTGHLVGRVSDDAINFLSSLLVLDPARRPAPAEALEYPWLVDLHPDESASGRNTQSELSTQMSLQSPGKQNSKAVLPRLSIDVEPRSNTDKWHGTPHSQSPLRSGGDNGLVVETQKHSSPSVTQPYSYRRRIQYIMDQSNAGSDAAMGKQPPSSQIDRPRHTSKGQQRAASSALPPPETFGIQTEPSVVINATESVSTHRTPTAPALSDKLGTSTPEVSSSPALTFLKTTVLGKELREAIEKGEIARVRDLVRVGADIENMNDRNGLTAIHYASAFGHKNIVEFLLDSGANIRAYDAEKATPLHSAASGGYSDITRLLLDRGAVTDEKDEYGWTPFLKAARNGHVSVARELLESGADIYAQWPEGWTALHIAAFHNNKDIVSLLLAANADINVKEFNGQTALYVAAQNDCSDIVNLLLAANADINAQESKGRTALHIAASHNNKDIVSLLLAADAIVNVRDWRDCTALYVAAHNDCSDIVNLLLAANADINAQESKGRTALHIAASHNNKDIVSLLLAADAIVNVRDWKDCTALYLATQQNSEDVVSLLLAANADINAQESKGRTALHIAAQNNSKNIVTLLLIAGADVTLDTEIGMTALHTAAYSGHMEVVFTLLQTAINVWAKNNRGKTALDLAKEKGHSEVIALLEKPRGTGKIDSKTADIPVTKEEGKRKAWQAFFSKKQAQSG